jgi:Uma2 family endonuclease
MNVQLPVLLSKRAFLDWVQGREERYELVRGRVVMIVGASRAHGRIVTNLVVALVRQLNPALWSVIAEFGIDAGADVLRYPDVVVDRAHGEAADFTATSPVLIAEVLSPSTSAIDLRDKVAEYLELPGLLAYLVFSQDEPKAWIWVRGEAGFSPAPIVLAGRDPVIEVPTLGVSLPLSLIYP